MSLGNSPQMFVKERQRGDLHRFWGGDGNTQRKPEKEHQSVFNNCLTGMLEELSLNEQYETRDFKSEEFCNDIKRDINSPKDIMKDLDTVSEENEFCDDLDETDYFDSEDEYWEKSKNKKIEDNPSVCAYCLSYHLPRSVHEYKDCPYEEAYDLSPWCTPAVQKFAKENNFEIKDVYGDGNCLFRAVADQFMVNGCPGHTETSLRESAIKHLESDQSRYGVYTSSFLFGETWESYLQRMKKPGEWGDHIILQALADVFLLHISVYNTVYTDFRRTDITCEQNPPMTKRFHITLGHVGESHYFSLRPLQWKTELPYKAQVLRMMVTNTESTLKERTGLIDSKFISMVQGHFPDNYLSDCIEFVLQDISLQKEGSGKQRANFKQVFLTYTGKDIIQEDTEDSRRQLLEDQSNVDQVSGIPLQHLTFIMKQLLPSKIFKKKIDMPAPLFRARDVTYHILGSQADVSTGTLRDITRTRRIELQNKFDILRVVVLKAETAAIFPNSRVPQGLFSTLLLVDSSETHPGYCRLKFSSSKSGESNKYSGSEIYQKAFTVPNGLHSKIILPEQYLFEVDCLGVLCVTFPFHHRWNNKKRINDFPSTSIVSLIMKAGCTLIPRSHPKSSSPDFEWKFDFSAAEHVIFENLTAAQIHGFYILKVLIENNVHHLPFKTKHLKSVFLMACEKIQSDNWETNFSGCVMHVLTSLLLCFKSRFLPDYFIPENNLIDCHREDDITTICALIEYIRLFPANVIQIVVERYGFTHGANLIQQILSNVQDFTSAANGYETCYNVFLPLSIATAKTMAKMGFYDVSLNILTDQFEQSLLAPKTERGQMSITFSEFVWSALKKMKQKASRIILARLFDIQIGSNVLDFATQKERDNSLQIYLPWTLDNRIGWVKIPPVHTNDLIGIANFLYDYSKREYWRRNVVLAELAIKNAIKCIQETIKEESFFKEDLKDASLKAEVDAQKQMLKKKLIPYYAHLFNIARIEFFISPMTEHMDDIESLCMEFPEMYGLFYLMCIYTKQPEKKKEYVKKMIANFQGKDLPYSQEVSFPMD